MTGNKSSYLPVEQVILDELDFSDVHKCFRFGKFSTMRHTVRILNPIDPQKGMQMPESLEQLEGSS